MERTSEQSARIRMLRDRMGEASARQRQTLCAYAYAYADAYTFSAHWNDSCCDERSVSSSALSGTVNEGAGAR